MALETTARAGIEPQVLQPIPVQVEGNNAEIEPTGEVAADLGVEAGAHGDGPVTAEVGYDAIDAHGGAEAAGMPQLDFSTFPNQIFWLLVTLFAIYFVVSRIAMPRIGAVLAERQGTVTNDLASAEELKLRAQEAEAAYDKALADARAEANRIADETRASIQADLDAELARADEQIGAKTAESEAAIAEIRAGAMDSVRDVATDTAKAIVAAFGATADDAAIAAAVDQRVKG
ncbi:FoF1 ATP synthase, subunit B [Oceanicola granulosus HTCC2516]|uniref:ATP synthase subunit b n=1 Tax=Oceanicola granulosus (strain ATCC BAA-861 / DSM 15982 / KCTC 12143 / HTCC2516) TaxID=314256 RepID=Q2CDQ4_OCEGH|nr:FoF1 ATP synthase, subunit B [Oceanicola granulosus HTCC2516]